MTLAIDVTDLSFRYDDAPVVNMERFQLDRGRSIAVIGPSGCGKTTFLHLLAGLIQPARGTVRILGEDITRLKARPLDRFRGKKIGLVFQRFHLLPALNVRDNILLAQRLAGTRIEPARVAELLDQLNLGGLENHKPSTLSHGQAQRVAIARALAHRPPLILADEPTSALDDGHAAQALDLLKNAAQAVGAALLIVTHDSRVRGRLEVEFEMEAPA